MSFPQLYVEVFNKIRLGELNSKLKKAISDKMSLIGKFKGTYSKQEVQDEISIIKKSKIVDNDFDYLAAMFDIILRREIFHIYKSGRKHYIKVAALEAYRNYKLGGKVVKDIFDSKEFYIKLRNWCNNNKVYVKKILNPT